MSSVLFRMSYSSIIRESEDLGAGIFDAEGNELAESDSTPMFMGAMPKIVKGVISLLGEDIHDGDVILHNDPYLGATHSPDVAIVVPIFFDGDLVGFSGASAHLLDIGGAYPGLAVDLVDNWSEGNIYRAVKLSEQGVRQDKLWQHILENTRTPTYNRGDIEGMLRPIKVIAPKGSIFNPNYPRACFARFCQVQRAVDLVLRALAPVVPEQITAGNSAHLHFISYSGFNTETQEYWVYLEVDEGSYGGRPSRDGLDAVDCLIANTRNNPIEELEWRFPMRTERYELRDEPCAAGN